MRVHKNCYLCTVGVTAGITLNAPGHTPTVLGAFLPEFRCAISHISIIMKVLKFGGTSVGTVESLRNVKNIVESCEESVVVVVSALGGFTDKLIATARMAEKADMSYQAELRAMRERHYNIIDTLVPENERPQVRSSVDELFGKLTNIYHGICLLEELSTRSLDKVVSFGERLSSCIISRIINGARLFDSTKFIRTLRRFGKHMLDNDATQALIHDTFDNVDFKVAVVPGFISTDADGRLTNLGRGGSDYTAAILAAALDAHTLEIWTDVDGFMTADPRIVSGPTVIPELSFTEAMELCNFGAKVIYPPTIYPVFHKNIPIYIKNTFNPSAPGTCIREEKSAPDTRLIKGVSSIVDSCLLTVKSADTSTTARALNTLARNGVSVLLVSHASTSDSLTMAIAGNETDMALDALNKEFSAEIETGELQNIAIEKNLTTIAIVGDNLRQAEDISSKLKLVLASDSLQAIAFSQGVPETSISFVTSMESRQRALQTVHDAFCS